MALAHANLGFAMEERRQHQRIRTFKSGTISTGAGSTECLVRNVSKTGACLELENPASIPEKFKLIIKPDNVFRTCKVVWRTDRRIGVRFA
jgi:hypothetical protein